MDQILAFLNNQQYAIIAGTLVGIIFKFFPAFKDWSNAIIPFLVALTAWAVNVFGPAPAEAAFLGGALKHLGGIFVPVFDAVAAKFIHDFLLRGALSTIGVKKPESSKPVGV